jgi:two-component system OmpR family sensor kinase
VNRLSLRARLLLGVIALVALGLAAADIATYTSQRSFLLSRVDQALEAAHAQVEGIAFEHFGDDGGGPGFRGPAPAGADWYELRTPDGTVIRHGFLVGGGAAPRLPTTITVPNTPNAHGERVSYFTAASSKEGASYRIRASVEPQAPGVQLIVASALSSVDGTLAHLRLILLIVTFGVLAALTALGLWVVHAGLRPLREIEATAARIAAGDLSQRVELADDRTEVGRLGLALNGMLARIEAAFRAQEASEQKLRRFVSDASHELRTPLAAVRAYAELFGRGASRRPEDLERSLTGIVRESERMSLLVQDLLLLARLDEGRPLEREAVSLDEVVTEAVDAAQVVEPERPFVVEVEPATVIGDRERLRQIVDNLLSNVRAHTPPRTPVRISVARAGDRALVSVADSGPGLTDEQLEHVFERFYRADESRARASGGVGLGLSIVAAVADAHGGRAFAGSDSSGATFAIELPLADSGSAGPEAASSLEPHDSSG